MIIIRFFSAHDRFHILDDESHDEVLLAGCGCHGFYFN